MLKKTTILLSVLSILIPALALADEAAELKKQIVMDQKKLVVMENMGFTEEEAKEFWPVYEKHQQELFKNAQQVAKIILSYASVYKEMKDDKALALLEDFQQVQKQRLDILTSYTDDLKKILPGTKVFRCLQVEYKLEAIARFEMAKVIPLAQ